MNSLYNNLGPRRSRGGGGDIFISISIVISLIIIFYMVYKLIQRNKSEDDKDNNNKDDTVLVPEISPPVMGMVLMPDKDNTNTGTEQYEIDNGKLETYKIEYQTDINTTLSKNVKFSVDWNNTIGFNTVNSITFTHYIKSFETNADYVSYKTEKVVKPTSLGTDVISKYFKNGTSDNRFTFDGRAGDFNNGTIDYSVLGYNRIGISINYGDGDGTDIVVYGPDDFNNDEASSAKVTQDDLAATFELLSEKRYTFLPEETKETRIGGTYIKNVYHVFPYKGNAFNNHFYSYLGKTGSCNADNIDSKNYMVSLNLVGASKDTFKIQIFPGDFDTPITDNSGNNYLGFCDTNKSIVSGGISKENALSFIMVKPPTDITLPTDTPDKTGTVFLGYKTFKVVDGAEHKFLVISNGLLKLKKWEDLTVDELPTMIMAFYKKDVKGCYVISPDSKSDELRRFFNNQCHEIRWKGDQFVNHFDEPDASYDGNQIFNTEALCENTTNDNSWKLKKFWVPANGNHSTRNITCEWRNPTLLDWNLGTTSVCVTKNSFANMSGISSNIKDIASEKCKKSTECGGDEKVYTSTEIEDEVNRITTNWYNTKGTNLPSNAVSDIRNRITGIIESATYSDICTL